MAQSVFVVAPEGQTGKSAVAYGLLVLLSRQVGRVGVFRPVTASLSEPDPVVELLLSHPAVEQEASTAFAVTYDDVHADLDAAMSRIVDGYGRLLADYDALVVIGSDYTDISTGTEWSVNSAIAANLGAPVVLVVSGRDRTPEEVAATVGHARGDLQHAHVSPVAVFANRVAAEFVGPTRELLATTGLVCGVLPEVPLLTAPTVAQIQQAIGATLLRGNPEWLQRESLGFVVAAMSLPNVLVRMREAYTIIAPGDRTDVLPALLLAHQSGTFPALAAIILNGGYRPPDPVVQLIDGVDSDLPILLTDGGTFDTATRLAAVRGRLTADSRVKLQTALRTFDEAVDGQALLDAIDVGESDVVTPLMFQYRLIERARTDRKRVVLPESDDDRILQAADSLLRLRVADLVLLGEEAAVRSRASSLGLDISGASIVSPNDPELVATFAAEYARLRTHKGMTVERAAEIVCDVSYFGTMMVHLGMADGMVSGAAHTTAHTIKPSFEIIKTVPGTKIVSSVFLMCLADEVLVYGDCAVNPDPTSEQLADIAISSATTAAAFGIDPRVAMLSYSTGTSGSGADVEKVRLATDLVHEQRPDLLVEGPIQYDAAVDASVARTKLPDSQVAGRATVLIFPDLNTGNNTYKAVQRSAGAIAIGPVLQGLNKPVNDLSRGALVADIVNTVAITAIQAQTTGETA
ncbi:phosphate acetyltransferase [Nakamurella flava]|uniref:Phosphate acetyltransferase n=1 Tax=Nakamurella flava TaxID=2576308 RepID=A0A4U6QDJ8_9ACTN|nr:phosphate acetyltransferase [Nakamurella flava]TKV58267.1 phosphate acetyltransferase [Nakamurella flava]